MAEFHYYQDFYAVGQTSRGLWYSITHLPTDLDWVTLSKIVQLMKENLEEMEVDISTVVWTNMGVPLGTER